MGQKLETLTQSVYLISGFVFGALIGGIATETFLGIIIGLLIGLIFAVVFAKVAKRH